MECQYCGEEYYSLQSLAEHVAHVHPETWCSRKDLEQLYIKEEELAWAEEEQEQSLELKVKTDPPLHEVKKEEVKKEGMEEGMEEVKE